MSDGRSLAGASLAAKGSLFCHSPAVYFLARPWQGSAAVYTWHIRELSGKCGRGTQECVRHALIRQPAFEAVAQTLVFAASALSRKLANAPRVYRGRTLPRSCEEIHRRRVAKKQAFCRQRRSRRDRLSLMPTPSR